jgi:Uma2 family endonuclease
MSIAMQEWPQRHRITVEHFYRMGEAGLFAPDERVELVNGEIIDMPPMGMPPRQRIGAASGGADGCSRSTRNRATAVAVATE